MADTKISALSGASPALAAMEIPVNDAGTTKKIAVSTLDALLGVRKRQLASTVNSTSTTPAKATDLDITCEAATYIFEYYLRWRTSNAANGVKFDVNFSGSVNGFVWQQRWVDTSATASTAVPDQDAIAAAGQVQGAFASRAVGTAGRGVLLSADTVNLDMLTIIEGTFIASGSGDLQLYFGSEVATTGTQSLMIGSCLRLTKL